MSKVKIQGNASGTGVLTVTAPNTSTDRTITLPDTTGTLLDENSSVPAANLTGTVADARISALTASKLTGALPAISGASLTGLPSIDCDADAWHYYMGTSQDNTSNAIFDIGTVVKKGSNISESGGVITVGTAGWYLIILSVSNHANNTQYTDSHIRKNNTVINGSRIYWDNFGGTQYVGKTVSVIVEASANDTFDVYGVGSWFGDSDSLVNWVGVRIGA